ncbi:hypothetical protein DIPPA_26804 [Diplonema papillatum]|nr:hypothetical protein DIPPA_02185 [Diplonema papillatum]KAJ9458605.1 hypothetical protein DIPPA_26804 [Diplonema papillatum]
MYDDDTVFGLPISSNGSLDLDGGELMSLRGGSAVNVLVSSPDTMRIYAIAEAFDNSHFSHTLFAIGLSETGGLIELDAASIELGNHSVLALAAYGDSIVAATEETLNLLEYDADTRATRQVGTGPYSLQTSATMQLSSTYGYIADAEGVLVAVNWSALAAPETWAPSPAPETSAPDTPMPSSYTPDVPYEPRDRTTFVFTILGIVAGAGLVASCVVGAFVVYNHRRKKNKAYEPQEAMSVWPSAIN